jgi:aminoglycoside phosphotransferase (APT) family kinase protein
MSASKRRPKWSELPIRVRSAIERLVGGRVGADPADVVNCTGGFSPGLASLLRLVDGRLVFVKAMNAGEWPDQVAAYRTEASIAVALPADAPAPAFLGSTDADGWVILGFEGIEAAQPAQPWQPAQLDQVAAAVARLAEAMTPSPIALPREHPRLGGWADLASDGTRIRKLAELLPWAAGRLPELIALERAGLAAAQGHSLVHFDMYAHNILLTPRRVLFVDWPHARLGAPFVDLLLLLSTAAADGIDPEPLATSLRPTADVAPAVIDAVLAAHAGFCLAGGLEPVQQGLEPIYDAKLRIGFGALHWLRQRLTR